MAALIRRARWPLVAATALLLIGAQAPTHQRGDLAPHELVVVVHGMGRSSLSMWPIARALEAEGYEVLRYGYSSYCCTIPQIAADFRLHLADRIGPQHTRVHFVGHSLGNILVRHVLTRDTIPPRVGRVVMLAPPNQGALAANRLSPYVGWLLKPTPELRATSGATVLAIPQLNGVEIGIIAASGDRTVKLAETHLPEEKAHVVVGGGHSFIMYREDVQRLTVQFIKSGSFAAESSRGP